MNSQKCLSPFLIGNINHLLYLSLFLYVGIGIDLGTTYTRVFAPVKTFYNSTLPSHEFDVLCAITPDGRATEAKITEKSGQILIGKYAVGKTTISGFKNSITKLESQNATRVYTKRLLEMIERLDEGISVKGAQFVLGYSLSVLILLLSRTLYQSFLLLYLIYQ